MIQLDPIHPGPVSHILEIFVGGSFLWRTLPLFIPRVHDSISDSGAQGFGCVHLTVIIIFMVKLDFTNEKILSASNAEVDD